MYNISKGQLVTVWVFAVFIFFWAMNENEYSSNSFYAFFGLTIPFVVIFYTVGWRNNKNKK
ncbi:MAG: hypothetical protein AAB381_02065 [Patescibacteria group bacterium]